MAILRAEVWQEPDGNLRCAFAGPLGAPQREGLSPQAKVIRTIEAGTYREAMDQFYAMAGWGPFTSTVAFDDQPFPEEWVAENR